MDPFKRVNRAPPAQERLTNLLPPHTTHNTPGVPRPHLPGVRGPGVLHGRPDEPLQQQQPSTAPRRPPPPAAASAGTSQRKPPPPLWTQKGRALTEENKKQMYEQLTCCSALPLLLIQYLPSHLMRAPPAPPGPSRPWPPAPPSGPPRSCPQRGPHHPPQRRGAALPARPLLP